MTEKILYNVLKKIGSGKEYVAAPDNEYLIALQTIGLVKLDWTNELTPFGEFMLRTLENKIEKW
jgi:hypothetical protein